MSNLAIEPVRTPALENSNNDLNSASPKPTSEVTSSPLVRIPSRNFENLAWAPDGSIILDELSQDQGPRCSRISTVLRKTKGQIGGIMDVEAKTTQELSKKEIKNSLNSYFKDLTIKLSQKDKNENVEFKDAIKAYFSEKDNQKNQAGSDSDNLLNKSLILVDQLCSLSTNVNETNIEKLDLFVSILADQLEIHNHKYYETRKQLINSSKEKNYLQKYNSSTLKIQTSEKWCQVHKALTQSYFSLQINSMKIQTKTYMLPLQNFFFVLKGDKQEIGRTTTLSDSIIVNISKDNLFEGLILEIYENSLSPSLIGECQISMEDVFENTLFNKNYRVELPIILEDISEPITATTNGVSDSHLKPERPSAMTDKEFNEYLQSALLEGKKTDLVRVSFQVELDTSFVDIIEDMREQRLKNLDVWTEEIKAQSNEQSEYLKFSIAPINTLIFDYELGIRSLLGIEELQKGRESSACGMCNSKCSIF